MLSFPSFRLRCATFALSVALPLAGLSSPSVAQTIAVPPPSAAATAAPAAPMDPNASLPAVDAKAYLVVEATSGQVLAEFNSQERRDPASLTKLMTAYLVFDALHQKQLSLSQGMRVPEKAWRAEGSRMFIKPGVPITVEDLLRGLIIQSGNDAAITLATAVGGNESIFIDRMNREAQRLGMVNTQFRNPTGLTEQGHYSTAHDLAILSLAMLRDFPQYTKYYAEKTFSYGGITQPNRNRLLNIDPTVDGLKTGHTEAAGYSLITTVNRPPRRLVTVLLGAPNEPTRINDSKKLIDWAFAAYEGKRFYEGGKAVQTVRVWKSSAEQIPVGFRDDVVAVGTAGSPNDVTIELQMSQPLIAPLQAGDKVGSLQVKRAGQLLYERDLLALEAAPQAGFFTRAWHSIVLWWKGLFG